MELHDDTIFEIIKKINLLKDDYMLITLISMKYVSNKTKKLIKIRPKYLEMKIIFRKLASDGLELIKVFNNLGFRINPDDLFCFHAEKKGHFSNIKMGKRKWI